MTPDEPHWSELPAERPAAPTSDAAHDAPKALPPLGIVARRMADVSPSWADVTIDPESAPADADVDMSRERSIAVESIREGWLLHRGASRLAADASPDLALLVGDWAYAAGLCEIADNGTLDDVAQLASLVADVSARCDESIDELALRWNETTEAMRDA